MTYPLISEVTARAYRVPLPRPWGPEVPANHVIVCRVTLADGRTGTGFTWTPQIGAGAVHALLTQDCRDAVLGRPAHPETVWDELWAHLHEAGSSGITTMAMTAIDTALWDLRAAGAGHSLAEELGLRRETAEVYGSGVNLHYSLEQLTEQARRWKARGHRAVKVKVGHPEVAVDVARIAAVREAVGPDVALMVDANQRWDLLRAREAIEALRPFGLRWVEEPLRADDLAGHVRLRRETGVPVAVGENLRTVHAFRDWLTAGGCDVVQPNVARVGGITPFRRIAELAALWSVPVWPHLLPEVSGQLACALPLPAMVEDVEDASFAALGLLAGEAPVTVRGPVLRLNRVPGLGLRFDPARLAELAADGHAGPRPPVGEPEAVR
ncbi:mandelate racemase/muconate lactonizing enzyme family protein [Streptomyces aidingensis]|uniref:L-alanine-DL-glutamate epimerase n=1 Tax=Streptomyces aidingensis TaxID=910347 RepID=A0A1I1M6P1_9ACTN|nr:mandelate racemase/muconate lactonizing enzyme family protein [Streptomyces aidingensis]SFC80895.1 L-alanine-DL-glutamate epimerase [Streptomyces aidingensis]